MLVFLFLRGCRDGMGDVGLEIYEIGMEMMMMRLMRYLMIWDWGIRIWGRNKVSSEPGLSPMRINRSGEAKRVCKFVYPSGRWFGFTYLSISDAGSPLPLRSSGFIRVSELREGYMGQFVVVLR